MVIIIFLVFFITILSGYSTMIGCLLLFIKFDDRNKIIRFSLLFSSIIMLLISVFDLIPASFNQINKIYDFVPSITLLGIFVLLGGILIYSFDSISSIDNKLYKIGIISFISLIIHNIPEGMITFIASSKDIHLGISMAILIAVHNIPEGIIISIPIYYSKNNKKKAIIYTLIAALSEPFGALISLLLINKINLYLYSILLAITAGIMIYLSLLEYLKESFKYKKKMLN